MLDRRLGGATIYQQTTAHVEQIDKLVRYALPGAHWASAAAWPSSSAAASAGRRWTWPTRRRMARRRIAGLLSA